MSWSLLSLAAWHCCVAQFGMQYLAGSRHHRTSQVRQQPPADHSTCLCTFKQFVLAPIFSWCFALGILSISAEVAFTIFSLLTIMICATVVQLTNKHSSETREAATSLQSQMPYRPEKSTRGNCRYTVSPAHFTYTLC